ncbi:MAG: head-tail adaptor protein [Pseudomonadota bacterium]
MLIAEFQAPSQVATPGGGRQTTWQTQFSLAGVYRSLGQGNETELAGAMASEGLAVFKVRRTASARQVDRTWRLVLDNRTWNVLRVPPINLRSRWIAFHIAEGDPT